MGKTLVKLLSSYIDTIKTEKIKNFVVEILNLIAPVFICLAPVDKAIAPFEIKPQNE